MTGAGTLAGALPVAVLDANVLYPQFLRDVLLRLAAADLFVPRWTYRITAEWVRNVAADFDIDPAKLTRTVAQMNAAFPTALVEDTRQFDDLFPTVNANDRHVAAAALAGGADLLVTWNSRHFPQRALTPFGIQRVTPDGFVTDILTADLATAIAVLQQHRIGLHRPPYDREAYRAAFRAAGLSTAAELLP